MISTSIVIYSIAALTFPALCTLSAGLLGWRLPAAPPASELGTPWYRELPHTPRYDTHPLPIIDNEHPCTAADFAALLEYANARHRRFTRR